MIKICTICGKEFIYEISEVGIFEEENGFTPYEDVNICDTCVREATKKIHDSIFNYEKYKPDYQDLSTRELLAKIAEDVEKELRTERGKDYKED